MVTCDTSDSGQGNFAAAGDDAARRHTSLMRGGARPEPWCPPFPGLGHRIAVVHVDLVVEALSRLSCVKSRSSSSSLRWEGERERHQSLPASHRNGATSVAVSKSAAAMASLCARYAHPHCASLVLPRATLVAGDVADRGRETFVLVRPTAARGWMPDRMRASD